MTVRVQDVFIWIGCIAVAAVFLFSRKRRNFNPPPAYQRPPAPPAPPKVRKSQRTEMETITITKTQLQAVLLLWEQDARDGKTRTNDESRALPVDQVASESANYLWGELSSKATE